ncbi:MAG TPA: hypothetical protein VK158_03345 [Acidobacteriota bacterium]|nr:hypothetical protein [Acidobacteriota bacterium]
MFLWYGVGGMGGQLIWLVSIAAMIWVIYDVWKVLKAKQEEKIIWTVAAVIGSWVTAIIYYLLKKRK